VSFFTAVTASELLQVGDQAVAVVRDAVAKLFDRNQHD
jgi:hypothetical protein